MPEVDLNSMDDADIAALATRCLDALSLAERVQAVMKAFHSAEDRAELSQWLEEETDVVEDEE